MMITTNHPNLEDADGSGTLQMAELLHGLLKIRGIGGTSPKTSLNDSPWVGFFGIESFAGVGW